MNTFVRRLFAAFIKQRHFISLALVLGAIISFAQATPVLAATGEWIDSSTIKTNAGEYKGPAEVSGKFRYIQQNPSECKDTPRYIEFDQNPTLPDTPKNPAKLYAFNPSSMGAGCIPKSAETITLTNTERVTPIGSTAPNGDGTDEVACVTNNSLGWIICPMSELLGNSTAKLASLIEELLVTDSLPLDAPRLANDDARKGVYLVWGSVRNLANVALVVAIIIIIYSQATSYGLSNYGVKKMLPKLVVASILINISYFVCAILIDVFNLLGSGVAGLFTVANESMPPPPSSNGGGELAFNILGVTFGGLGLILAAGFITVWWPLVIPLLITVVLAFLGAVAVLLFREVAIIMLIIVSPLAFAAWLLPNTEQYFKKWLNFFQNLLIMYPIIMGVVYGSLLASNVIATTVDADAGAGKEAMVALLGLAALAIPLFSLPFMLKFAGALGNKLGAVVNNPNRGPIDRANKWAKGRAGDNWALKKGNIRAGLSERYGEGYKPSSGRLRGSRGFVGSKVGSAARGDRKKLLEDETAAAEARIAAAQNRLVAEPNGKIGNRLRAADNQKALSEEQTSKYQQTVKVIREEDRAQSVGSMGAALRDLSDAKYALDQRDASANRELTGARANRLQSDDAYAAMAGGISATGAARVRGAATEAILKLNNEEVQTHNLSLNRNGATLAAAGFTMDASGVIKNAGGVVANAGMVTKALKPDWKPGDKTIDIDIETAAALKYASSNNLTGSSNGAKSLISTLAATGNLTTESARKLVEVPGVSAEERGFIAAHLNAEAGKAGLKHLQYNTVVTDTTTGEAKLQVGGQFGGTEGVVNRIMQNGVSSITKEMYADQHFGPALAEAVTKIETLNPETFNTELVKMDPRKIENLVKAQQEVARMRGYAPVDFNSTVADYTARREKAVKEYGLTS